jgi:peroxiredoxin
MRKINALLAVLALLSAALAVRALAGSSGNGTLSVGNHAPYFTLQDQDGSNVSLSDFVGKKIVVLEWTNPNCPFVKRHYAAKTMQTLAAQYKDKGVIWLAINSTAGTTNDSDKQWAIQQNIAYPILNDVDTHVGKAFLATNTPEMYIIKKNGILAYKGAIDNDPDGDKTNDKVNYVQKALDEILAGQPVSQPETKAYGCHVSYRD